ncbi:MAG: amidohydrolase family protein [Acidimicrobiales bacterium]
MTLGFNLFDFDNHYYEATDAFTRHLDPRLRSRGVQWVTVRGRERLLVGGQLNSYIPNPTFDPVAKPGALFSWYRGNPDRLALKDAFGELEPIRPEYRDRDARLAVMDEQGLGGSLLFPTLGVGIEDALKHDPAAAVAAFEAFNRWLEDDWGYAYRSRLFAVPYIQLLDPAAAALELQRVLDLGAVAINIRNAPVPVPGGHRSPFEPAYDAFWGLVNDSGVVVATHAALEGYDTVVNMWESGAESSLFRTPLRGVISKGRAVADFYGAAVCQLLFERFDRIRFASVENGASWVPDLMHRLGDAANRNPGYFSVHPTEVFADRVWVTPFWEDDIESLIDQVPAERLLLGSDWPHAEGVVAPEDFVTGSLAWADASTTRRIARDNALELLGVDVP